VSTVARPRLEARSRWSSAAKCARQGAYGLLGVEPIEPDDRTKRLWIRGKQLGAYVADSFAEKYGEHNIIREKAVPWPGGILHTDVYVIPERVAVEVKSTSTPASILDAALTQLAGEVHFDPDTDAGLLALVNPSDLSMEFVPFRLTDEWIERVERIADEVMRAGASRGQMLPDRVCAKPSDGIGRFCPFISHCFEGWAPAPLDEISSIEVVELARQWVEAKQEYRRHKEDEEAAHGRYKEIEAALSAHLEPGRTYQVGPYQARRIVSKGRETFQIGRARKAGQWTELDDERWRTFVTVGQPSERYDIQLEGGGSIDYGEVPF